MRLRRLLGSLAAGCAALALACGPPAERGGEGAAGDGAAPPLLVYSGRNESLVGPLLARFSETAGVEVRVRYAETAELAATLLEEGPGTPAEVFISQDAAALGALAAAGVLRRLDDALLARVPPRFRAPGGEWVGVSGRLRTVVYNTEATSPAALPRGLAEVAAPRYRGRFGVAPTNASFQAHMAAYGVIAGEPALVELLAAMAANGPRSYPKNSAIVAAVAAGEIDWGLVNHYYLWRELEENPGAPAANFFMTEGPAAAFANLAGAAVLADREEARGLVAFLLSDEAQRYFVEETFEYPLVEGVAPAPGLPPLAALAAPEVDFARVAEALPRTLERIGESGLIR